MTQPFLPRISPAVRHKAYQPSGKFDPGKLAAGCLICLPVAAIAGLAAQFPGFWIPHEMVPYSQELFTTTGVTSVGTLIFSRIAGFTAGLLVLSGLIAFPCLVGLLIGSGIRLVLRRAQCRSPIIALLAGITLGAAAYLSLFLLRLRLQGVMDTSWSLIPFQPNIDLGDFTGLAVAVDALLWVGVAAYRAYGFSRREPFCEHCNRWYKLWKQGTISIDYRAPLLEAVERGILLPIPTITSPNSYPHNLVRLSHCPSCEDSPCLVSVTVKWKDSPQGTETVKQWLRVMIPMSHVKPLADKLGKDHG